MIANSTESPICRRGKHLFEAIDMQKELQRPGHAGMHLPGGHVSPEIRHEPTKETLPSPDRVEKVAMTTHVERDLRLFYKIWAARFHINMQDMQSVVLNLGKARLESVPEHERLALWEAMKKEAASAN
jgi:hypothetical protein